MPSMSDPRSSPAAKAVSQGATADETGGSGLRVAVTTLPEREQALAIARAVVDAGLAACAQVDPGPITAIYRWEGRVCEDAEWRLVLKTRTELEPALRALVRRMHPYAVPQWLHGPVVGSDDYAAWVSASTATARA